MEKNSFEVYKKLVHEIAKGKEQVQKLQASSSSSSGNQEKTTLEKMSSAYEEALSILVGMDPTQGECESIIESLLDPLDFSTSQHKYSSGVSMERKSLDKNTTRVIVDSKSPQDDGFAWKKYGEKDIIGSNYPRSYFRCAHRMSRGCPAVKLFQRLDGDGEGVLLEIVYKFKHTCLRPTHQAQSESTDFTHFGT